MSPDIEAIRRKFAEGRFEFSKHAVDQSILRQIRVAEVKEAMTNGQGLHSKETEQWKLIGMNHSLKHK